jgi:hypothetical protein
MKLLNHLKTILFIGLIALSCSSNKERQASSESMNSPSDTVSASEEIVVVRPEEGIFAGEYLIGDGNTYIVPVGETFEMRDGTGKASDVFYFQGKESDTISVYSNKSKSVTFKMNPDHKTGKYYADGEELPVELVGPVPEE